MRALILVISWNNNNKDTSCYDNATIKPRQMERNLFFEHSFLSQYLLQLANNYIPIEKIRLKFGTP